MTSETNIYIKPKSVLLASEMPTYHIMTGGRKELSMAKVDGTLLDKCVLMSAEFMPYATKHRVVSAFFGT